jgi:hypothetical protein
MSAPQLIDARGPRMMAVVTFFVLAFALLFHSTFLIVWQLLAFATAAIFTPPQGIYGRIYRAVIQPRLKGRVPSEDIRPPRFAALVGTVFATLALAGLIFDVQPLFTVATSFAVAAAFLNGFFNYCLGCETYLLFIRLRGNQKRDYEI